MKNYLKNIKRVDDFRRALKNEVADHFKGLEMYGFLDDLNENQKITALAFGFDVITIVYNPIQKRYTMQERKKYDKALNSIDVLIKLYREYIDKQDKLIAQLKQKLAEVKNDARRDRASH